MDSKSFEKLLKDITVRCSRKQQWQVLREVSAALESADSLAAHSETVVPPVVAAEPLDIPDVLNGQPMAPPTQKRAKTSWHLEVEAVLEELKKTNPDAKYKDAMTEAGRRRKEKGHVNSTMLNPIVPVDQEDDDDDTLTMTTTSTDTGASAMSRENEISRFLESITKKGMNRTLYTKCLMERFQMAESLATEYVDYHLSK